MQKKGFPKVAEDFDIYHYKLPSHGPNPAVHFMWKQPRDDEMNEQQQSMLVSNVRQNSQLFYNRAGRRVVKNTLHRLGVVKPHAAEYLIRTILNDYSQSNDKTQKAILERLEKVASLGEDIIVDLRANNGQTPKFDEFSDIVQKEIDEKTAVDDRRHTSMTNTGNVIVNMAMALSRAPRGPDFLIFPDF